MVTIDAISLKEVMEKQEKIEKQIMTKEGYQGVSFYDKETITLEGWYEIDIDRVKTKLALLHWIAHLLGKKWVTKEHLSWVVRISSGYHGYNPHLEVLEGKAEVLL